MTHKHHSIPRSRGGADTEWNIVEVDHYAHAYGHALDFVLFNSAPRFDFRHEAWPLLPESLKEAVLAETSRRMSERQISKQTRQKTSNAMRGKRFPGRTLTADHKEKIADALRRYEKTPEHIENFRASVKGRKAPNKGTPHSEETKRKISEAKKGSTPWNKGLSRNGK